MSEKNMEGEITALKDSNQHKGALIPHGIHTHGKI
jgi:hypothetical protein